MLFVTPGGLSFSKYNEFFLFDYGAPVKQCVRPE